jgi:hypothetical protein
MLRATGRMNTIAERLAAWVPRVPYCDQRELQATADAIVALHRLFKRPVRDFDARNLHRSGGLVIYVPSHWRTSAPLHLPKDGAYGFDD